MKIEQTKGRLGRVVGAALSSLLWLTFCIHLFRHWRLMSGHLHDSAVSVALIFPFLWLCLFREKSSLLSLAFSAVAFIAAANATL